MLYFRGCTAREKQKNISKACEELLKIAGVDFHVLDDEPCCGSVLLRTGFHNEALKQIEKNTELLKDETIVTSCAGCYKTFSKDYKGLNVVHISQLLNKLIKENKLNFNKSDLKVTYHDPCHLSRDMEIYDEPRAVILSVADLVEMENHHENSLCCGAGGGVKSSYPQIAQEVGKARLNQAKETECDTLITTCPFCKVNLENDEINVLDLCEFLRGALDE